MGRSRQAHPETGQRRCGACHHAGLSRDEESTWQPLTQQVEPRPLSCRTLWGKLGCRESPGPPESAYIKDLGGGWEGDPAQGLPRKEAKAGHPRRTENPAPWPRQLQVHQPPRDPPPGGCFSLSTSTLFRSKRALKRSVPDSQGPQLV